MSDKAQPTPGPWRACGTIYEHMNAEVRSGAKGEGAAIAQVWDGPNAFPNARLIAAAPDMLALVERVAALNPDAGEIGAGMLVQLVTDARSAIAKATVA